jgi:drug/metabolite transporter (DMT)-like permease
MEWYILALLSAIFSAVAAIYEKKTLFKERVIRFSTIVGIISLVFSIPFFFLTDYSKITLLPLGVLFIKSIMNALSYLCIMKGIKKLEISEALPLLVLTPGIVAIAAFFIIGDKISFVQALGMIFLLFGIYVLQIEKKSLFNPFKKFVKSKGHHYILLALFLQVTSSVLDKLLLGNFKMPPTAFMAFQQLFLAIIFLVIAIFLDKDKKRTFSVTLKESWPLFVIISLFTVGYRYTQIEATKIAPVALVLSIKRISVLFAVIIGGKLFEEKNLLRRIVATAIMLIGAYLVVI